MKIRLGNVIFTAVAVSIGFLTLLGYFVGGLGAGVRVQLLTWGSLLAAVAVLIGALNLVRIHFNKMLDFPRGWYSIFVVLGFFGALAAALVSLLPDQAGGPTANVASQFLFQHVIGATSAALSALLVFILVFAGYRMLRRPPTLVTVVFLITAVAALVLMAPVIVGVPEAAADDLRDAWAWLSQVPAVAGARGLMLGIALGIIATGLRILLAMDRPYGD